MAIYAVVMLAAVALVVGPVLNDRAIAASPARALATVTHVGPLRTAVEFQDAQGHYHSPPTGLLYPTGVGEGQRVWVTYAADNPNLVKIEGRGWTLALIPALSVVVVVHLVILAGWAVARRVRAKN